MSTQPNRFRSLAARAAGWGLGSAWSGACVGALAVRGNLSLQGPEQAWPALAWVVALYLALGAGFAAVVELGAWRATRATCARRAFVSSLCAALAVLPVFAATQATIAQVNWRGASHPTNVALALAAAALTALVLRIVVARRERLGSARVAGVCASLVAFGTLAVALWGASAAPARELGEMPKLERAPTALPRVLVIGVDGLDWDRLRPLVEAGRAPHFARLIEQSYRAPLATFEPTWSPIVWNTISTGVPMEQHGVQDFTELEIPGLARGAQRLYPKLFSEALLPEFTGLANVAAELADRGWVREVAISGLQRRSKAFWNVLSEQGVDVGVVRWWASWPAEDVRGWFVSDNDPLSHALSKSKMSVKDGEIALAHMTSPPELAHELISMIEPPVGDARVSREAFDAILRDPILRDLTAEDVAQLRDDAVNVRWFDIIRRGDEFSTRAALHLWSEKRVTLCAVYLRAIDNLSHRMWRNTGVVDHTYEFTDARLGELLAAVGDDTTVMVLSDHGWCYEPGPRFAHNHAPPGVLILRGPDVAPRQVSGEDDMPTVFDIAPTLLALYDVPKSAAVPGRVLKEAFRPGALAAGERSDIPTWGSYRPKWTSRAARGDESGRKEAAELLRHLGYLDNGRSQR